MFKKVSMRKLIIGSFLLMAIVIGVVGFIGIKSVKNINDSVNSVCDNNLKSIQLASKMRDYIETANLNVNLLIYNKGYSNENKQITIIEENLNKGNKIVKQYENLPYDWEKGEESIFKQFKTSLNYWSKIINLEVIKNINHSDYDAENVIPKLVSSQKKLSINIARLMQINSEKVQKIDEQNDTRYENVNRMINFYIALGILVAIIMCIIMVYSVFLPIKKVSIRLRRLSNYDLSDYDNKEDSSLSGYTNEIGDLTQSLASLQKEFSNVISEMVNNIHDLSSRSQQLSASTEEIMAQIDSVDNSIDEITKENQNSSASTEELLASIEEVDSSIKVLADRTNHSNNEASEFKNRAIQVKESGQIAYNQVKELYLVKEKEILKAMEKGKVVSEVKSIADTISNIAKQTNLLALNATIEAARAGEAGRGFAVVADEVKKLAEQSVEAVKNIKEITSEVQEAFLAISNSSNEILKFMNEDVTDKFDEFVKSGNQYYNDADYVSKLSEELASMTEELSATISQIDEVVKSIAIGTVQVSEHSETVQQNINSTNQGISQIVDVAQDEAEMAQTLDTIINKFKI